MAPPKLEDAPARGHSRDSSTASARHPHTPATPSQLRQAHVPSDRSSSPEEAMHRLRRQSYYDDEQQQTPESTAPYDFDTTTPAAAHAAQHDFADAPHHDGITEVDITEPNLRSRLLHAARNDDSTPRPGVGRNYGSFAGSVHSDNSFGGAFPGLDRSPAGEEDASDATRALLGDAIADGLASGGGDRQKMSTTRWLAERHGIKSQRMMYLQYYVPVLNWTRQYQWRYLKGDLVAAITMASFYIPMALSYASNLAHLPPVHGLYSFAINPLIYGILGTCPQMIVGPEAPGSLLVGEIVRENIKKGASGEGDGRLNAEIAGIVTCMAGGFIFVAGLFRLGFLDNVLSRPFLRGFISAIGVVIFIDQLIPETGLARLAAKHVAHGSSLDKLVFLVKNIHRAHKLTCAMSFSAFFIIMFFRYVSLTPLYPQYFSLTHNSQRVQEASPASLPQRRLHTRPLRRCRPLCHPDLALPPRPTGPGSPGRRQLQRRHLLRPLPL